MDDRFWTIHLAVYRELQSGQKPAQQSSMQSSSLGLDIWHISQASVLMQRVGIRFSSPRDAQCLWVCR